MAAATVAADEPVPVVAGPAPRMHWFTDLRRCLHMYIFQLGSPVPGCVVLISFSRVIRHGISVSVAGCVVSMSLFLECFDLALPFPLPAVPAGLFFPLAPMPAVTLAAGEHVSVAAGRIPRMY